MTLVELLVVVVLSAALFAVLFKWVFSLVGATGQGTALSSLHNTTAYASQLFASDVAAATPCDAYGITEPIRQITATSLSLYVSNPTGGDELVMWKVSTQRLERAVLTHATTTASCAFTTSSPSWSTILTDVSIPASGDVFIPWSAGSAHTTASSYGTCTTASSGPTCMYTGIQLDVIANSTGPGAPQTSIDVLYPLSLGAARSAPVGSSGSP